MQDKIDDIDHSAFLNVQHSVNKEIKFQYESPLPPASEMQTYQKIDEDIPRIIIEEYQLNSKHVREQEQTALLASIADNKRGQYLAFAIAMGIFAIVVLSLWLDKIEFASASGLAFVAYLAAMVYNTKN